MPVSICTTRQLHPSAPVLTVDTTLTAQDEADLLSIFGVEPTDVQSSVAVSGTTITGESKYLDSVNTFDMDLGHHFLILHITADNADEIKVSMDPTQSQLTTLDESGVIILQMKDDQSQTVKVVATNSGGTTTKNYAISGMTFAEKVYTEEELNAMTKAAILELAASLEYEMTSTDANTKAEIIAEFLEIQAGGNADEQGEDVISG